MRELECQALGIDRNLNRADLCSDIIYVEDRGETVERIVSSSRIGINEGKKKKWRFFIENNEFVSKKRGTLNVTTGIS